MGLDLQKCDYESQAKLGGLIKKKDHKPKQTLHDFLFRFCKNLIFGDLMFQIFAFIVS